jgi:hypothetical protein
MVDAENDETTARAAVVEAVRRNRPAIRQSIAAEPNLWPIELASGYPLDDAFKLRE